MITVKLFGLLRLDSGIRERQMDVCSVREVLQNLAQAGISKKDLAGCVIFVNGETVNKRRKLADGDTVMLMPPVAGG